MTFNANHQETHSCMGVPLLLPVIPSEEGIQATLSAQSLFWIPIFMGMTHGKKQPSAVSDQP